MTSSKAVEVPKEAAAVEFVVGVFAFLVVDSTDSRALLRPSAISQKKIPLTKKTRETEKFETGRNRVGSKLVNVKDPWSCREVWSSAVVEVIFDVLEYL